MGKRTCAEGEGRVVKRGRVGGLCAEAGGLCMEEGGLAALKGLPPRGSCKEPPTLLWGVVNEGENEKAGFVTFIRFPIRATPYGVVVGFWVDGEVKVGGWLV